MTTISSVTLEVPDPTAPWAVETEVQIRFNASSVTIESIEGSDAL